MTILIKNLIYMQKFVNDNYFKTTEIENDYRVQV